MRLGELLSRSAIARLVMLVTAVVCAPIGNAASPVFPGEFRLNGPTPGIAPFWRGYPRIASGGNGFLAVWSDQRLGKDAMRIWATRLDREGLPLDPAGLSIGPTSRSAAHDVAWTGSEYLVAWSDGSTTSISRVSTDGVVKPVQTVPISGDLLRILFHDGQLLIAAAFFGRDAPLRMAVLDRAGDLLQEPRDIVVAPVREFAIGATAGREVLLVTSGSRDGALHSYRIEPRSLPGHALSPVQQPGGIARRAPVIASDGSDHLCVWLEGGGEFGYSVRAALLDEHGKRTSETVGVGVSRYPPSIVWTGSEYLLFYANYEKFIGVRFAADGRPLEEKVIELPFDTLQGDPAAAALGSDVALIWPSNVRTPTYVPDVRDLQVDMRGVLVRQGREFGNPRHISHGYAYPSSASGVWTGSGYLFVWLEWAGQIDHPRIVVGGTSAEGAALDGAGVMLAKGIEASIATNESLAIVTWVEHDTDRWWQYLKAAVLERVNGRLVARRVSQIDDTSSIDALNTLWNGTDFVVFYVVNGALRCARISTDGSVAPPVRLGSASSAFINGRSMAAVWTGRDYYVVYSIADSSERTGFQNQAVYPVTLFGRRVSAELIPEAPVVLSRAHATMPHAGVAGEDVIVSWVRWSDGSPPFRENEGLRLTRVRNGTPLDPVDGSEVTRRFDTPFASTSASGVVTVYTHAEAWSFSRDGFRSTIPAPQVGEVLSVVGGGPAPLAIFRGADGVLAGRFILPPRARIARR